MFVDFNGTCFSKRNNEDVLVEKMCFSRLTEWCARFTQQDDSSCVKMELYGNVVKFFVVLLFLVFFVRRTHHFPKEVFLFVLSILTFMIPSYVVGIFKPDIFHINSTNFGHIRDYADILSFSTVNAIPVGLFSLLFLTGIHLYESRENFFIDFINARNILLSCGPSFSILLAVFQVMTSTFHTFSWITVFNVTQPVLVALTMFTWLTLKLWLRRFPYLDRRHFDRKELCPRIISIYTVLCLLPTLCFFLPMKFLAHFHLDDPGLTFVMSLVEIHVSPFYFLAINVIFFFGSSEVTTADENSSELVEMESIPTSAYRPEVSITENNTAETEVFL